MADRPIIFSAPMVLALLAGHKTQTRRLAASPLSKAQAGDRLWVREAFSNTSGDDTMPIYYKADAPLVVAVSRRFQPSIHMPRWASCLTLTVTQTRTQPLQDITGEDARAEGCPNWEHDPVAWYAGLWDQLHRGGAWGQNQDGWAQNPAVIALSFTVARGNIHA